MPQSNSPGTTTDDVMRRWSDITDTLSTTMSISSTLSMDSDEGQDEKNLLEEEANITPKVSVARLIRILPRGKKEGYLTKRDEFGFVKGWKKFYFCISNDGISYYHDEEGKKNEEVNGDIVFHNSTLGLSKNKKHTFKIQNGDQKWHLRAESDEERDDWMRVCKAHMKDRRESTDCKKVGYLHVVNNVGKNKRRFFVLKGGHLNKYRSDELTHLVSLPLCQCNVIVKDSCTFTIRFKNRKMITLRAETEVEARDWIARVEKETAALKHMQIGSLFSSLSCITL